MDQFSDAYFRQTKGDLDFNPAPVGRSFCALTVFKKEKLPTLDVIQ